MERVLDERLVEDKELLPIAEKVLSGERLSFEDGVKLFRTNDLLSLGRLADYACRKKSGSLVYFTVNRHLNLTNVCVGTCKFCAFRKRKGEEGAFELSVEGALKKLEESSYFTEVHVVSGLHPDWGLEDYLAFIRAIKERYPKVKVQAFTAEEVDYFCRVEGLSVAEVMEELVKAGVDALPGGGAEIFNKELRRKLCPDKLSPERYLEVHETAHRFGLKSNASILYGHIEGYEDRVEHLIALRELQDRTGGFMAFVSFAYQPRNTELGGSFTTGFDDLKLIAVSRLLLDNFYHVRAFWITLGEKLAQLSLHFGANDLDGTVVEESITRSAGAQSSSYMPKERLLRLIKEAGRVPVERDTLYNPVRVYF
jgi:aminodeoxyfutalosine synthase